MRNKLPLAGIVCIALLALAGCGPKGGTVTLINESTYMLESVEISLGESKVKYLYPGQWIKASHDKNVPGLNAHFSLDANGKEKVKVEGKGGPGTWFLARWSSSVFSMNDGEAVVLTVRNAP